MLWLDGVIMGCLFSWRHWLAVCQGSEERSAGSTCAQPLGVWNVHTQCAWDSVHNARWISLQAYPMCFCHPLSHMGTKSFSLGKVRKVRGAFILSLDVIEAWRPEITAHKRCVHTGTHIVALLLAPYPFIFNQSHHIQVCAAKASRARF